MTGTDEIKEGVRKTYDRIAPHFAVTRDRVWPPTRDIIKEHAPCRVGDLGCGTGRALVEAAGLGCRVTGIDSSPGQLQMARSSLERSGHIENAVLMEGDLEELPLGDEVLDLCLMIAALHHLPDRKARTRALEEAYRVTAEGGFLQVSVWTWDQERFRKDHLSRIEGRREPGKHDGPLPGDFFVPWKKGAEGMRFYHLFGPGELEEELSMTGWTLLRSFFDGRNHWAECVKAP
ncbi:MAG: class I SAM-dependent methyltransferase [Thermoplasmatota archaeon]